MECSFVANFSHIQLASHGDLNSSHVRTSSHSCPSDEDEDGDRITVCSDEELAAMLSYVSADCVAVTQLDTSCLA